MTGQGIVIAGTHSGCGKTTLTLGIMAALKKKGLKVQSFKAGPDFIDSGLHGIITGRPSRNLDLWMCGEDYVRDCFQRHSADADVSVVEGVMGFYDGEYSTADLADTLSLPVILVVDAYGMAESAGAVVKGFRDWGLEIGQKNTNTQPLTPNPYISGVIFNRVASENHFKRLKESVHDVPVLGYLPRDLNFEIPHRHLGLIVAEENPIAEDNIKRLTDTVLEYVDVDAMLKSISNITVLSFPLVGNLSYDGKEGLWTSRNDRTAQIALAYDRAFCFYYEDNIDFLRESGAEIVKFSPLSGRGIPDGVDAVYIGGGYPELHAEGLSKNISMLKSLNDWAESGKPMYAECGGLMYLSQGIYDFDGNFFKMCGVFPFETQIPPYPHLVKGGKGGLRPHLGYREIILKEHCILGRKGDKCRGHEFHYSELQTPNSELNPSVTTCYSLLNSDEGYRIKNTLASYVHIHFGSNPGIADNFINFIKEYKWKA